VSPTLERRQIAPWLASLGANEPSTTTPADIEPTVTPWLAIHGAIGDIYRALGRHPQHHAEVQRPFGWYRAAWRTRQGVSMCGPAVAAPPRLQQPRWGWSGTSARWNALGHRGRSGDTLTRSRLGAMPRQIAGPALCWLAGWLAGWLRNPWAGLPSAATATHDVHVNQVLQETTLASGAVVRLAPPAPSRAAAGWWFRGAVLAGGNDAPGRHGCAAGAARALRGCGWPMLRPASPSATCFYTPAQVTCAQPGGLNRCTSARGPRRCHGLRIVFLCARMCSAGTRRCLVLLVAVRCALLCSDGRARSQTPT
jgi:hypothetical protein